MELIDRLDHIKQQVLQHYSLLSEEQINWKCDPSRWSIAQCLDHLIVSNQQYFPVFDKVLHHHYRPTLWQKYNPLKRILGFLVVKMLGPRAKTKYKSPKVFQPSESELPASIVYGFAQHQHDLKNYYLDLQKMNAKGVVISSPASRFVSYSLNDAFKLIANHEQRHFNQSLLVFNHPNFPKIV